MRIVSYITKVSGNVSCVEARVMGGGFEEAGGLLCLEGAHSRGSIQVKDANPHILL
jgi:hypothetical protein